MSTESQEDWRKETQEDTTKAACIEWWNKEDNHWWDTKEDQVFNSGKQVQSEENKMIWCELNILFKSTVEKKNVMLSSHQGTGVLALFHSVMIVAALVGDADYVIYYLID